MTTPATAFTLPADITAAELAARAVGLRASDEALSNPGLAARFAARIEPADSGCWLWAGPLDKLGYGTAVAPWTSSRHTPRRAHRVAFTLALGPIPTGFYVLHDCDVPGCCNPAHLRAGTASENTLDAVARGRHRNRRVLSDERVRAVRDVVATAVAAGHPRGPVQRSLAEALGVSPALIQGVVSRTHRRAA